MAKGKAHNPTGINQYSPGKGSGTFKLGTKSANSSNKGVKPQSMSTRQAAQLSAKKAAKNKKK